MKLLFITTGLLVTSLISSQNNRLHNIDVHSGIIINVEPEQKIAKATYFVAKEDVIKINYKKSRDITSIRAFRKATQLRSKKSNKC
jgi:hypothetical protein